MMKNICFCFFNHNVGLSGGTVVSKFLFSFYFITYLIVVSVPIHSVSVVFCPAVFWFSSLALNFLSCPGCFHCNLSFIIPLFC